MTKILKPIVWHFCGETNTRKNEKNQERALRFIYEDYSSSYEDLLNKSRLPTLKIRPLRTMAIEVYKILNKKSPMYLNDLFVYKESRYYFRKTNTVEVPQVRTTYHGLIIKEKYIVNLPNFVKCLPIRFNTFNCLEAFLHIFVNK
jgi:hypothetical protein